MGSITLSYYLAFLDYAAIGEVWHFLLAIVTLVSFGWNKNMLHLGFLQVGGFRTGCYTTIFQLGFIILGVIRLRCTEISCISDWVFWDDTKNQIY